jgi:hypothetical protein
MPNVTVDIFVTHTAASDYNSYYRQIQVEIRQILNNFALYGTGTGTGIFVQEQKDCRIWSVLGRILRGLHFR